MRKTLLALVALVAVGAAVLLWVTREEDESPGADAGPSSPASASAPASAPEAASGTDAQATSSRSVPEREREQAIRVKVNRVLETHPDVARVTDIRCTGPSCRVEMEAIDLDKVGRVMEKLAAPGQGFTDEAQEMRLERPVLLGTDGGPYRVAFTLMF